jgi:mono/diheme cytochrome c family protein
MRIRIKGRPPAERTLPGRASPDTLPSPDVLDGIAKERFMMSRTLVKVLPAAVAMILVATGCSKKEPEAPAAAPEAAAAPAETSAAAPAPEAVAATTAAAGSAGASAYSMYCVTCHGAAGKGDGVAAAALNPKPADFSAGAFKYDANGNGTKGDIDDIKAIVHDGAAKHGGSPLMAPWPMLSADQLQAVAEHVKSLHGG